MSLGCAAAASVETVEDLLRGIEGGELHAGHALPAAHDCPQRRRRVDADQIAIRIAASAACDAEHKGNKARVESDLEEVKETVSDRTNSKQ